MKNVFLSRPNWMPPSFEKGMEAFCKLLEAHELCARTIGKTDFPSKSPMDGVIELMSQCDGAIVLGYPQINLIEGVLKGNKISNCSLPTEWNHIEASLAYSLRLPLLVIHHVDVSRGIFDRGVLNCFLYQMDLEESSWPFSTEISGALQQWKLTLNDVKASPKLTLPVREQPKIKWGSYLFEGDDNLYCPKCYETDLKKIPTLRNGMKFRLCPVCNSNLPSS